MKILCLESSTSSAKAMLYDTKDQSFRVTTKPYLRSAGDNGFNRPEDVFAQTCAAGKELAQECGIDMVSLSNAWHSVALFDAQLHSITPVYDWAYTGAAGVCRNIRQDNTYTAAYYQKTGCMVNAIYPFFKLQLLAENGYRLRDCQIMGQGTYNTYRLTGSKVISKCMASGTGLMNIHRQEFDKDLLEEIHIVPDQLCEVVASDAVFPLSREGAELLGVKAGIPVVPANSDGGLNQIGAGAIRPGTMTFSMGTSGALRLTTEQPVLPEKPSVWCYMSPKAYMTGAATNGCCNCVDWFKKKMFAPEVSYGEIEAHLSGIENTPVFLPFLFGERCPGWNDERRGGFAELTPDHDTYAMYRAIEEGVIFNLYQCYRELTDLNGEPEHIKFSGGILNSPLWTQMCADIFGKELEIDGNEQGSLLGAAVLGAEILGEIDNVRTYSPEPAGVIRPDPEKTEFYREKYETYLSHYNYNA